MTINHNKFEQCSGNSILGWINCLYAIHKPSIETANSSTTAWYKDDDELHKDIISAVSHKTELKI